MDILEVKRRVAAWAAQQPLVTKVWLYGSRVKGTERPDSDIDIAVEIRTLPGDSDASTTFTCEGEKLRASLSSLLEPLRVDLQWYGGPTESPNVSAGILESSIPVYQADRQDHEQCE
jgi:predicted nucleotidyltransferase